MNYNEILTYLYQRGFHTINLGLERIETLLKNLGNPEKELKVIHVAGTNGKGSVCAMCTSILMEAGYKVGLYTSPHLVDFTERFKINSRNTLESRNTSKNKNTSKSKNILKNISKKRVEELFAQVKPHITNETYFEIITAMAFLYFRQENVEVVVLEVGMGGRLDATNVVTPLVAVITTISKEHTQYLGNTIEKIAFEKAGIIKEKKGKSRENNYVVINENNLALNTFKEICEKRNAKLLLAKPSPPNLKLSLKGEFQRINAGIAIKAVETLTNFNYNIPQTAIINGLKTASWPGRFEFIGKNVVVDCAHNPEGIKCLVNELNHLRVNEYNKRNNKEESKKNEMCFNKFQVVFGAMKDKNIKEMISLLLPIASTFILTKPKGDKVCDKGSNKWSMEERAEEPENIANIIIKTKIEKNNLDKTKLNKNQFNKKNIYLIKNPLDALKKAKSLAKKDELVVVCGSCFLAGDVMREMKDC